VQVHEKTMTTGAISFTFASDKEATRRNIEKVFTTHASFFTTRGIANADELCNVVEWKYTLANTRPYITRTVCFSEGFHVNWDDKAMVGYTITAADDEQVKDIMPSSCAPGCAYFYGITMDQYYNTDNALQDLVCDLIECGLWTVDPVKEPHTATTTLGEQAVSFSRSDSVPNVYYLYIKAKLAQFDPSLLIANSVDAYHEVLNAVDWKMGELVAKFITNVKKGEAPDVVLIWSTRYNYVIRNVNVFTCYIGCYPTRFKPQVSVVRDPVDGKIVIIMDDPIDCSPYVNVVDRREQIGYLQLLKGSTHKVPESLGYFCPPIVPRAEEDEKEKETAVANHHKWALFREKCSKWHESDCPTPIEITHLNNIVASTKTVKIRLAPVFVAAYAVMFINAMPRSNMDEMSDAYFLDYCARLKIDEIKVNISNLPRIIYMLQRYVKNERQWSGAGAGAGAEGEQQSYVTFKLEDVVVQAKEIKK
jgi:hypothetical protein